MKQIILVLVILGLVALSLKVCDGYRILGIFPLNVKSHFAMYEALMKSLARKGHQIDVVSTFPQKTPYPNYTDLIDLPLVLPEFVNNFPYERMLRAMKSHQALIYSVATQAGNKLCQGLGHPEMQKLIHNPPNDPPYDLVLTEVRVITTARKSLYEIKKRL